MLRLDTHDMTEAATPAARRVAVFGLGYVGSVSAACLASRGHSVIGVDVISEKVGMINVDEVQSSRTG
jgi:GDP-mannose 6-dehydrogenase